MSLHAINNYFVCKLHLGKVLVLALILLLVAPDLDLGYDAPAGEDFTYGFQR